MVHVRFKMYFFLFVFDRKYEQTICEITNKMKLFFTMYLYIILSH